MQDPLNAAVSALPEIVSVDALQLTWNIFLSSSTSSSAPSSLIGQTTNLMYCSMVSPLGSICFSQLDNDKNHE
ncbi:hypothetical protein FHG87_005586 [Trinorchestia longiramus]|nr:hypothetical protein FHG87_005586 [Trinorchestia longiramus]